MAMGIPPQLMTEKVFTEEESRIIHNRSAKVYAYVDVEAFFAQAGSNKLGLDHSLPLASIENDICISVNYPALNYGVKKGMSIDEAKKRCPNIILVQTDTFKIIDSASNSNLQIMTEKPNHQHVLKEKKVHEFYRGESDRIFSVLRKKCPLIEKIALDQGFLDITSEAYDFHKKGNFTFEWRGNVVGGDEFPPETEQDLLIMIGSQVIEVIRKEIRDTFNYNCSAGISYNKMLAKIASGLNKPNGQSIIVDRYVIDVLKPVEINQLKNFSKQIIETLESNGYKTLGQIQKLSLEELQRLFKDPKTADWVYFRARGFDDGFIEENDLRNKSIILQKSFRQVKDALSLDESIDTVVTEMCRKVSKFYEQHGMVPSLLCVRFYDNILDTYRIKSVPIDLRKRKEDFHKPLKEKTMEILNSSLDVILPCTHVGLIAKHFEKNELDTFEFDLVTYAKMKRKEKEQEKEKLAAETSILNSLENSKSLEMFENEMSASIGFHSLDGSKYRVKCDRCKCLLTEDSIGSHSDFHLAEDIDKEINPNKRKYKRVFSQDADCKGGDSQKDEVFMAEKKKVKKTTHSKGGKKKENNESLLTLDQFFLKK